MDYRLLAGIVKHRFQEATQRLLILFGDAAIALDYLSLIGAQSGIDRPSAKENESHIDAQGSYSQQISTIGIPYPALIAALGVPIDSARLG